MTAIQIVQFRLAPGADPAAFRALNARFQSEVAPGLPGLERREATVGEDGSWLLVLRYADPAAAKAGGRRDTSELSQAFMRMIDRSSMSASFHELVSEGDAEIRARAIVAPFYDALNRPATKDAAALILGATTPDWRSYGGDGDAGKTREQFAQQVVGFGKAIPDLGWDIREVIASGDRVVVRSTASGTPAGEFMGMPHTGRSFRIMATDVHTLRDGKLASVHHLEDWAGAMRQLKG